MPVRKQIIILGDTFHAAHGAVAVIIKLLVQRRPLINLHQAYIGDKKLQLILCQAVHFLMVFLRLLEVHAHKSAESQIVTGFRLSLSVKPHFPVSPRRRMTR